MTSGSVTASLGVDSIPTLGVFNDGRGSSTAEGTLFGFQITKPGLYPFRAIWFEGNGGADLEWYLRDAPTGARALINDPDNAAIGLRAFRNAPAVVEPTEAEFNPLVIDNGQVTLTWTGDGTLEESSNLIDWTAVSPQPGSRTYAVTPNAGNPVKFYRILVQP